MIRNTHHARCWKFRVQRSFLLPGHSQNGPTETRAAQNQSVYSYVIGILLLCISFGIRTSQAPVNTHDYESIPGWSAIRTFRLATRGWGELLQCLTSSLVSLSRAS